MVLYNNQIISCFTVIEYPHYICIINVIVPISSRSSSIKNKIKSFNLNSAYDLNSPIFSGLLSILTNNPMNQETQLKIEHFLKNQSLDLTKEKLSRNLKSSNNINISNPLISKLLETGPLLEKIIENYKINLKLIDLKLQNLNNLILINMNINFLIQIMYGRILNIVSNNQLLNNKTIQVEVTVDLGKEIVGKYLLECFLEVKKNIIQI